MEMTRRGFLKGMAGILAAGVAPAFIGSKILMPVRELWKPSPQIWTHPEGGRIITGVDTAKGYDYSAFVTMQWDGDDPNSLKIIDWGPKDREFKVTDATMSFDAVDV